MTLQRGVIKNLISDKGFGFIKSVSTEYFFHRSACVGVEFEDLQEGQEVSFRPTVNAKGPRAEEVSL